MRSTFLGQLKPALLSLAALGFLTGIVYPVAVTCVAQLAFARRANGSLIERSGSELIGQPFEAPGYFWSRPSATTPAFNGASSSGSNLGPTNPALLDAVRARVQALRAADPSNQRPVPVDLVTASGSGLDPHISPAAAEYQVERVARARSVAPRIVAEIVQRHVEKRQLGFLGEPRVNVLLLNLDLDAALRR
jgi:K+-transporting ATPase ATPase C chain